MQEVVRFRLRMQCKVTEDLQISSYPSFNESQQLTPDYIATLQNMDGLYVCSWLECSQSFKTKCLGLHFQRQHRTYGIYHCIFESCSFYKVKGFSNKADRNKHVKKEHFENDTCHTIFQC